MSKTSREELQKEALRFFILHDYEKSSLNDIARALGVTKGAIYHHFKGGKDELFLGAVNHLMEDIMGALTDDFLIRELPVKTILDNLFRMPELIGRVSRIMGLDDMLDDYVNLLYLLVLAIRKFPEFQKKVARIYDGFRGSLTDLLNAAVVRGEIGRDTDTEAVAYEVTAFYEGAILLSGFTRRKDYLELGPRVCDSIWAAIAPEKDEGGEGENE